MKSKYYIGKALKKVSNYKSPYREYFEEISGFTQFSLDFFQKKRENLAKKFCDKKKLNFDEKREKIEKMRILEENEENYEENEGKCDEDKEKQERNEEVHKGNEYKIVVNSDNMENSPKLIKNDYNIYINNIVFTKEIEKTKKKVINYEEEKTAKISQKTQNLLKKNIIKTAILEENPIKTEEILKKSLHYFENFAKIDKKTSFIEKTEENSKEIPRKTVFSDEIVPESEDSDCSSPNSSEKHDKFTENSNKKPKEILKKNDVFSQSKTSLGNFCEEKSRKNTGIYDNFSNEKIKKNSGKNGGFSKPEMIVKYSVLRRFFEGFLDVGEGIERRERQFNLFYVLFGKNHGLSLWRIG